MAFNAAVAPSLLQETVSKLEALDEPDSGVPVSVVTKPCSLEKPTQDLINLIFNNDMFNHALKSMEIGGCGLIGKWVRSKL